MTDVKVSKYSHMLPVTEVPVSDWEDYEDELPFDDARCALGEDCCAYNHESPYPYPAVIGPYLAEDDIGNAHGGWLTVFRTADGKLICEDCAVWIEDGCPID